MIQMQLLGKEKFWSTIRVLEEKITQCYRILGEFRDEKKALEYQLNMRGQNIVIDEERKHG